MISVWMISNLKSIPHTVLFYTYLCSVNSIPQRQFHGSQLFPQVFYCLKPITDIYWVQMQLNTCTPSSACWQGGQQGLLQGTEWQSFCWDYPIQITTQATWEGKKVVFKALSISGRWYNKKMQRNPGGREKKKFSKIKPASVTSLRIDWDSSKAERDWCPADWYFRLAALELISLSVYPVLDCWQPGSIYCVWDFPISPISQPHLLPHGHRVPATLYPLRSCCRRP